MSLDLYNLREQLGDAGALLTFSGSFSHSLIEELGMAMRRHLESDQVHRSAIMDVFSVFIEASQNIRNYTNQSLTSEAQSTMRSSIVVITRQQESYEVNAGNIIKNTDVATLQKRLEHLITLNKAELKELYKENLRKKREPQDLGAGLGLIEMARKASEPLGFNFTQVSASYSFFSIRVVI